MPARDRGTDTVTSHRRGRVFVLSLFSLGAVIVAFNLLGGDMGVYGVHPTARIAIPVVILCLLHADQSIRWFRTGTPPPGGRLLKLGLVALPLLLAVLVPGTFLLSPSATLAYVLAVAAAIQRDKPAVLIFLGLAGLAALLDTLALTNVVSDVLPVVLRQPLDEFSHEFFPWVHVGLTVLIGAIPLTAGIAFARRARGQAA